MPIVVTLRCPACQHEDRYAWDYGDDVDCTVCGVTILTEWDEDFDGNWMGLWVVGFEEKR